MKCFPVQELVVQHPLTSNFGLACSTTPCPEILTNQNRAQGQAIGCAQVSVTLL